jgi:alkylation response protein AidB-like acyl-CoA dehydrogenase
MENLGRMGFSEEQADLLDVATGFCREKSPIAKVRELIGDARGYDPEIWREIAELGWLGVAVPEAYGGVGLGMAEVVPIMEQMGRFMLAGPYYTSTLAAQAILVGGTEAQKRSILPEMVSGAVITIALAEENADWNLENISVAAREDRGMIRLSGKKRFVAHAAEAKYIIVSVLFDDRPALVVVASSAFGDGAFRRETIIDETKRSFEVDFSGVSLEKSALMDTDKAHEAFRHIDVVANLLAAAELVGGAQAVIDYTIDYLNTRKQFGKVIGSYQALKHPTVDAFNQYELARSHLYGAANVFNEQGAGEVATRMAKAQAEAALSFAADRSIQFHGGFGFTYDCDAQLYRRRAAWHASQFGDAAFQRRKLAELLF